MIMKKFNFEEFKKNKSKKKGKSRKFSKDKPKKSSKDKSDDKPKKRFSKGKKSFGRDRRSSSKDDLLIPFNKEKVAEKLKHKKVQRKRNKKSPASAGLLRGSIIVVHRGFH